MRCGYDDDDDDEGRTHVLEFARDVGAAQEGDAVKEGGLVGDAVNVVDVAVGDGPWDGLVVVVFVLEGPALEVVMAEVLGAEGDVGRGGGEERVVRHFPVASSAAMARDAANAEIFAEREDPDGASAQRIEKEGGSVGELCSGEGDAAPPRSISRFVGCVRCVPLARRAAFHAQRAEPTRGPDHLERLVFGSFENGSSLGHVDSVA